MKWPALPKHWTAAREKHKTNFGCLSFASPVPVNIGTFEALVQRYPFSSSLLTWPIEMLGRERRERKRDCRAKTKSKKESFLTLGRWAFCFPFELSVSSPFPFPSPFQCSSAMRVASFNSPIFFSTRATGQNDRELFVCDQPYWQCFVRSNHSPLTREAGHQWSGSLTLCQKSGLQQD